MRLSTPRDVGAFIRESRRRRGLSQEALAQAAGVSRFWLIKAERGDSGIELGLVLRVLRALGVSLDAAPPAPDAGSPKRP